VAGLQTRIRRDLGHAQWLAAQVAGTPDWQILAPVRLQTVVLRHAPPGLTPAQVEDHTRAWAQAVNDSGEAYLTPTLVTDRWAVRVSFGNAATEHEHVADLWRVIREKAALRPGA
jgi:aromatic-L-amino-acid decarboxylase